MKKGWAVQRLETPKQRKTKEKRGKGEKKEGKEKKGTPTHSCFE